MKYKVRIYRPATVSWIVEVDAEDAHEAESAVLEQDLNGELEQDASMNVLVDVDCDPEITSVEI